MSEPQAESTVAAIDLGSNSFHMIIAGIDEQGHVRIIDRLREPVRLRGGLDADNQLSAEVRQQALACLQRFGERIRDFPSAAVSAVGTNTLRIIRARHGFLDAAEQALGHPVAVISGAEEARLIYLGVAHTLAQKTPGNRFVMDIGGGSTELIIGEGFTPRHLESLHMGCVSSSDRFFPDGRLDKSCWKKAITAARLELMPIQQSFRNIGWNSATGASGTIRAVLKMIQQCQLSPYVITADHLRELQKQMIAAGSVDKLAIPGLTDDRKPVIAGGLAILISTFEALGISEMQVADGALREGLVYDRIDQLQHGDLHARTITLTQARFNLDVAHAQAVAATASQLFTACARDWELTAQHRQLLLWAAELHELGLAISHNSFHKHGAYLLKNLDLIGFSTEEQDWLSQLVRVHRRKINLKLFELIRPDEVSSAVRLSILLRLAVLLNRSRSSGDGPLPLRAVLPQAQALTLVFTGNEEQRPLLLADLEEERKQLNGLDFTLQIRVQPEH